eukprot:353547-Chlamydomonas_euryale.AAC.5
MKAVDPSGEDAGLSSWPTQTCEWRNSGSMPCLRLGCTIRSAPTAATAVQPACACCICSAAHIPGALICGSGSQ